MVYNMLVRVTQVHPVLPVKGSKNLLSKGIQFQVIDISLDRNAAMELARRTHQLSVPAVQIGDKFIVV